MPETFTTGCAFAVLIATYCRYCTVTYGLRRLLLHKDLAALQKLTFVRLSKLCFRLICGTQCPLSCERRNDSRGEGIIQCSLWFSLFWVVLNTYLYTSLYFPSLPLSESRSSYLNSDGSMSNSCWLHLGGINWIKALLDSTSDTFQRKER